MTTAGDFRVVRVGRDGRGLARDLEDDEPRTSPLVGALLHSPERSGRRAWALTDARGELAAAVVVVRLAFDRWKGFVHLRDPGAARAVARLVDRTPAVAVMGAEDDVRPLVGLVPRERELLAGRWVVAPGPLGDVLGPPSERTRLATQLDRDALVEFYARYEYVPVPTRWQLRCHVSSMVERHHVILCEDGRRIIGAFGVDAATRRYLVAGDLSVDPAHRRAGVAWELVRHFELLARALNVGASLVLAPSNPMTIDHPRVHWQRQHYCALPLYERVRFRGQGRLRQTYRRIQPLTSRTPTLFVDPRDPGTEWRG